MANEITYSGSFIYTNGKRSVPFGRSGLKVDVSGSRYISHEQTLSTSEEALTMGEVSSPGVTMFRNNSTTSAEIIRVRRATGESDFMRIPADNQAGPIFLDATAPYAISDSGTPKLEYVIVEA